MSQTANVVVVGGGIIGTAITYYLAKKGVKNVVLVERRGIGEESSSACDSGVMIHTKAPGIMQQIQQKSNRLYETLSQELGREVHYNKMGSMVMIDDPSLIGTFEETIKQQVGAGINVSLISGDDARKIEPCLSKDICAVSYCLDDALVSPMDVTLGYALAAERLGATVMTNTAVTDVLVENGKVKGVVTTKGIIYSEMVVNAAGVFSPEIGKMAGMEVPVTPRRGNIVVCEQVASVVNHILLCCRYVALKYHPELAETSDDPSMKMGVNLFLEQTHDGNILFGSNREWSGYDKSTSYEILRAICNYATHYVPFLKNLNIIRTYAGLRPYCDGGPILGPVNGLEGMIMATGHEGGGIGYGPAMGDIMSDYIIGGKITDEIAPYLYSRFEK